MGRCTGLLLSVVLLAACGGKDEGGKQHGGGDDDGGDDEIIDTTGLIAHMLSPNGYWTAVAGEPIDLRADFTFEGDGVDPAPVTWTSSLSGLIGTGNPHFDTALGNGVHTITVTATYGGDTATATGIIDVGAMGVHILSPLQGARIAPDASITFHGEASVASGGTTTALVAGSPGGGERASTYVWSSSKSGPFGGSSDNFGQIGVLADGSQTVTLTVTDNVGGGSGQSSSATVDVRVIRSNSPPTATITTPVCPHDQPQDTALSLSGVVADPDAPDAALTGSWTDSLAADTADGGAFQLAAGGNLGKHQIRYSVRDTAGAADTDVCDVWVVTPGSARSSLLPDAGDYTDNLALADDDVHYIGSDGAGDLLIANDHGLTVFDATPAALATYDGFDLGVTLVPGDVTVDDAVIGADDVLLATDSGLAHCDYAAGALSACIELDDGDYAAVAISADFDDGLLAAGALDGLRLETYSGGVLVDGATFDIASSNLPVSEVRDVLFSGSTLYIATGAGLCIAADPAAAFDDGELLCTELRDPSNSILPSASITALAVSGSVLWLGTFAGIVSWDLSTGVWHRFNLIGSQVNDITLSSDATWMANEDGVWRLDAAGGISHFDGNDWGAATTHRARAIFVDSGDGKWFGTDAGVVRYTGK